MSYEARYENVPTHSSYHQRKHTSWGNFLVFIKKNFIVLLTTSKRFISIFIAVISTLEYGLISFLFEFSLPKTIVGIVLPPVLVYLIGTYMTLLPSYVVIPLIFAPARIAWSVLGISMIVSFFKIFLI